LIKSPVTIQKTKALEYMSNSRSLTNKSRLVRQKSFEEPVEQLNGLSSIEIYNDVIANDLYDTIKQPNDDSSNKVIINLTNNISKDEDDDYIDDEDFIDTIDDIDSPINTSSSIDNKFTNQQQQQFELNNLSKQTVVNESMYKPKKQKNSGVDNSKSAIKRLLKL
jgi:hypothetical protein